MVDERNGTFFPDAVLDKWEKLRLNGPTWNVLIVIARRQWRYGGYKALITMPDIAKRTGHSVSTVKRSMKKLCDGGLLVKLGRGSWRFEGISMMTPSSAQKEDLEGVNMVTSSRCHDHEPFPILLLSLIKEEIDNDAAAPFSKKQTHTLEKVLRQLRELAGPDVLNLAVHDAYGGDGVKSYAVWLREVARGQNKAQAGHFVRAMLALVDDERVAGKELTFYDGKGERDV